MHVGAALAVAEHPPVLPGLVELAEVPGGHPGRRLVRVTEPGPLVGEPPQVLVELVEDLGRYVCPVVVGPSPNNRVEPFDHRDGVAPTQGAQLAAESFPDPSDRRLARFDQQLAAVAADVESQEVKAFREGDDARLVLVERQTPGRQPGDESCFDLERLLPGVAESDEVIGLFRCASYAERAS